MSAPAYVYNPPAPCACTVTATGSAPVVLSLRYCAIHEAAFATRAALLDARVLLRRMAGAPEEIRQTLAECDEALDRSKGAR